MSEQFIDEAVVSVAAGAGGDGCVAWRREKYVPRGGPAGGDGGKGGDVVFLADPALATLRDQKYQPEIRAQRGGTGGGNQRTGADGEDAVVRVPVGTVLRDPDAADDAPLLADLATPGERYVAARGGRGGRGNARFATPTRQTPDYATPGEPGGSGRIRLSLKLLADVGLVGLPNAGKSTLLRRISAARPRVADYPFTTLFPHLGVVSFDERRFVVADIPGLIEGASDGVGLGDRFLRHVERTRLLVHLLDGAALLDPSRDLVAEYDVIRRELAAYDSALGRRRELVLLNKLDLIPDRAAVEPVVKELSLRGCRVLLGSGATGAGMPELVRAMALALQESIP
jgi:GTP-binding protein